MLKIGDFARAARVSIKALRHYDAIGLLRPTYVDQATGYRYYSAAQLPVVNRLLIYKNLGFSLDQTRALLDQSCSPLRLRELLEARQAELHRRIEVETTQLAEVVNRIRQIERDQSHPRYGAVIRETEPCEIVSLRRTLPDYDSLDSLIRVIRRSIPDPEIQGYGAIWHRCSSSGASIDCEALLFLKHRVSGSRRLEGLRVASVLYRPSDDDGFPEAYRAALESIDAAHCEILAPMREIYHADATELQFPIRALNH